jgi:hypothetical protein
MIKAGYWDATTLITELAQATLYSVPPPADGVLYVVGDKTISGKTGEKQPLAAYTRMNGYQQCLDSPDFFDLIPDDDGLVNALFKLIDTRSNAVDKAFAEDIALSKPIENRDFEIIVKVIGNAVRGGKSVHIKNPNFKICHGMASSAWTSVLFIVERY